VVEPSPEPDVVEQEDIIDGELIGEGEVEPGEDIVEAHPEGGDSDVVEQVDTVEPDTVEPEQDDADVAGQETDSSNDAADVASPDASEEEVSEDSSGETGADTDNTDNAGIEADTNPTKKSPGCGGGCSTNGESSETADGTLLLGLGMLTAGIARFRKKISAVFARR